MQFYQVNSLLDFQVVIFLDGVNSIFPVILKASARVNSLHGFQAYTRLHAFFRIVPDIAEMTTSVISLCGFHTVVWFILVPLRLFTQSSTYLSFLILVHFNASLSAICKNGRQRIYASFFNGFLCMEKPSWLGSAPE